MKRRKTGDGETNEDEVNRERGLKAKCRRRQKIIVEGGRKKDNERKM